jgi:8-amino-3,8-dideoxy-alpha-D-manno-octulosonate transaminase
MASLTTPLRKIENWPPEFPGALWLDHQEAEAVLDVVQHGSLFRYYGINPAKHVEAYEEFARNYYGVKYALALNSGTGALLAAMTALDVGPGSEVIVPSYLWVATVGAIIQHNAIPVICEVDNSLTMDPTDLERKITPRTRLIVPIHMSGAPCNMDAIMEIAERHGIPVLEDCAQCNGGYYKGRPIGSIGKMGIFSLQLNKNITSGEGGLLTTNDELLYQRAFGAHDQGMIRVSGRLATPPDRALTWGQGRRMSELCGAVAAVQMRKLDNVVGSMRAAKQRIKAKIEDLPGLQTLHVHDAAGDTGACLGMILPTSEQAIQMLDVLTDHGVRGVWRISDYGLHVYCNIPALVKKVPLSTAGNPWNLPANAESNYSYEEGACPVSDELFTRIVLLAIPSKLSEEHEEQIVELLRYAVTSHEDFAEHAHPDWTV